ncbi:hypothetical protein [Streptomyces sp. NBRC 109706]|uniref:hypothetical protein n=1 Tax=Streptomyces sp. NBRC 109706 TaxID=1550035 RepID=UPI0007838AA8|nr:hypothetical protein [Streptomyces sp. NBRC 109706]
MTEPSETSATPARVLAIVDRAYRGAVEKQYADSLYLALELHRQLGGMDILLRGQAVSYAARHAEVPTLRVGERELTSLTDPRRDVERLLEAGLRVLADETALHTWGLDGPDALLPGVERTTARRTAERWADYRMVSFL